LSHSLDHVGPIARTVRDAQILFHQMLGKVPPDGVEPASRLRCRLGIPRRYFLDVVDREVRNRFDDAIDLFLSRGAIVQDVDIPHAADTGPVYLHISVSEAANYHAATLEQQPERYTPKVRMRLEAGRYLLAEDYVRAQQCREILRAEVDAALANCDALLLPTVPIPAPVIGQDDVPIDGRTEPIRSLMLRLTQLFNVSGHAAMTIPSGKTSAGLPCGIQLVGPRGRTNDLIGLARACETHLGVAPSSI